MYGKGRVTNPANFKNNLYELYSNIKILNALYAGQNG